MDFNDQSQHAMRRVTRQMGGEQRQAGPGDISSFIRLFSTEDDGNPQASEPLAELRITIHNDLLAISQLSPANYNGILAQMRLRVPRSLEEIELYRQRIVSDLHNHGIDPLGNDQRSINLETCANNLQFSAQSILNLPRHHSEEQDKFACGVLLMLLEFVVIRGHSQLPHRTLYIRLISHPPTFEDRLCVVDGLSQFTEDVVRPYTNQIQRVVLHLQQLPPDLRPIGNMIEKLQRRIVPPSRSTSARNTPGPSDEVEVIELDYDNSDE